jgi:hypothetical protein
MRRRQLGSWNDRVALQVGMSSRLLLHLSAGRRAEQVVNYHVTRLFDGSSHAGLRRLQRRRDLRSFHLAQHLGF